MTHRMIVATALLCVLPLGFAGAETIWHVKAVHPDGQFLDVKAIDSSSGIHDVKAIEDGDRHVMDIKALAGGKRLPVKVLVSDDRYAPVKAIGDDGVIYDIKALTADGTKLDVKGVKMMQERLETTVSGVPIEAHIKALPQVAEPAQ